MKYRIESKRKAGEKTYNQVYQTLLLVFSFFEEQTLLYGGKGKLKSFVLDMDGESEDVAYVVGAVNGIFGTKFEVTEEETEEEE